MSDYKLTYFDGQGLGELIRLVFVAAGVPFEDVRVDYEKDWAKFKPSAPYGVLPILQTEGQTYFQSVAIARHLARKFGLAGKTETEHLQADIIVDTIEDIFKPIYAFHRLEDTDKKKEELRNTYVKETLPKFLGHLEKLLSTNKGGDGFFVGDNLSWADLHVIDFVERIELLIKLKVPLENFPKLKGLNEKVRSLPKIKEYIAKRPASTF